MQYYILTLIIFAIIEALFTLLLELFGEENRFISFILWLIMAACFWLMSFLLAFINGKYNLDDKETLFPYLLACGLYYLFAKLMIRWATRADKFHQ